MQCSVCSRTLIVHSTPMCSPGQAVKIVECPTHGKYSFILLETPIVYFNNSRSTKCIVCGKPMQPINPTLQFNDLEVKHSYEAYKCEHCGSFNQADLTWRI